MSTNGGKQQLSFLYVVSLGHTAGPQLYAEWMDPDYKHTQGLYLLSRQVWACDQKLTGFVSSVQEVYMAHKEDYGDDAT